MSWHPRTHLSHLIRDGLALEAACPCGHVALLDPFTLRTALWQRAASEALADIPRRLRCLRCHAKRVRVSAVDRPPCEDHIYRFPTGIRPS